MNEGNKEDRLLSRAKTLLDRIGTLTSTREDLASSYHVICNKHLYERELGDAIRFYERSLGTKNNSETSELRIRLETTLHLACHAFETYNDSDGNLHLGIMADWK